EDPEQRTRAMMELLRSAATAATLVVVSAQGAKSDLDRLGDLGTQGQPGGQAGGSRSGNHGETIDRDPHRKDNAGSSVSKGAAHRESLALKPPVRRHWATHVKQSTVAKHINTVI